LFEKKDVGIAAKMNPRLAKQVIIESKRTKTPRIIQGLVDGGGNRGDIISGRKVGPVNLRQVTLDGSVWELNQAFERAMWVRR